MVTAATVEEASISHPSKYWTLRDAEPSDQAYVCSTWADSAGLKSKGRRWLIDRLLNDSRTELTISCSAMNRDYIVGWCAVGQMRHISVLEYVYVRKPWRGSGIAKEMLRKMMVHRVTVHMKWDGVDNTEVNLVSPEEFLL